VDSKKIVDDKHIESYRIKQYTVEKNGVTKRVIDMSGKYNTAELVFIGDWHIGTVDFDIDEAIKVLNYVKQTPNAVLLCLGDMMNTAILNSVSNSFEDIAYPKEQWNVFVSLLTQVKEKTAVIHTGNHERRVNKNTGIDPVEQAAKAMGIEEAYAPYFANTNLVLKYGQNGKFAFPIVTHHGDSGSPENNASVNQDSLVNAIGHTHQFQTYVKTKAIIDKDGNRSYKDELELVIPASGGGEYGYEKGYKPINKCPYFVMAVTAVKNELYDPKNKYNMQPPVILSTKSIAILDKAPSTYKEDCVKAGKKALNKNVKEAKKILAGQIAEFLQTIKDIGNNFNSEILEEISKVQKEKKPTSVTPKRTETNDWYISDISKE